MNNCEVKAGMETGEKRRDRAIDGLRAVMIMLIVLLHSCRFGVSWLSGTLGNLFFFLISGYLLTDSKRWKSFDEGSADAARPGLFVFLWDRLKKIYPAYLLSTAVLFVLGHTKSLILLLANVALVSSGWFWDDETINGPAWFLCVLLIDYVLFYVLNRFVSRKYRPYAVLVLFSLTFGLARINLDLPFLYGRTMSGISEFMLGCLLKYGMNRIPSKLRYPIAAASGVIWAAALTAAVIFGADRALIDGGVFYAVILVPLLVISTVYGRFIPKCFSLYPLALLGEKSMYLFIWHVAVQQVLNIVIGNKGNWFENIWTELLYLIVLIVFCFGYSRVEEYVRRKIKDFPLIRFRG